MANILITGGSGLIGSFLSRELINKGHQVAILSRKINSKLQFKTFLWDYKNQEIDREAILFADYIIHLAGENIGNKRWSHNRKQQIIDSRVVSGELLLESLIKHQKKIKAFITASAIGYYGSITSDKIYTETDLNANDFIGYTCNLWESVADKFENIGIRTVKIRTGVVLTREKGALEKMMYPLKFRIGAILGDGKQYLPWIHVHDLCNIYIRAIENPEINSAYNATAPEHVNYKSFIKQLALSLKINTLNIKIPTLIIKLIFGEMSQILLNGSRISSDKLIKTGYQFKFSTLKSALADLKKPLIQKK